MTSSNILFFSLGCFILAVALYLYYPLIYSTIKKPIWKFLWKVRLNYSIIKGEQGRKRTLKKLSDLENKLKLMKEDSPIATYIKESIKADIEKVKELRGDIDKSLNNISDIKDSL